METSKRLSRSKDNSMVAGVCAGLAEYFNVDVALVRLLLVAFTLFGGSGVLLYAILWLVMPEA